MPIDLTLHCTGLRLISSTLVSVGFHLVGINDDDWNNSTVYDAIDVDAFCKHHGIVRVEE